MIGVGQLGAGAIAGGLEKTIRAWAGCSGPRVWLKGIRACGGSLSPEEIVLDPLEAHGELGRGNDEFYFGTHLDCKVARRVSGGQD